MKNTKFFKNSSVIIQGHPGGYVTDGSIDNLNPKAVRDCNNMDFYDSYDERRFPIDYFDDDASPTLKTLLGTGGLYEDYDLKSFISKDFTDDNGETKNVIIAAIKKPLLGTSKLLCNYSYHPTYDDGGEVLFANGKRAGGGWVNEWFDLTEITDAMTLTTTGTDTVLAQWRTGTIPVQKPEDYYRGWFVYQGSDCIGIVTKSSAAALCVLTIRKNSYLNAGAITIRVFDNPSIRLSRFPVNFYNDLVLEFDTASFEESNNTLHIAFGDYSRPYWFGFIKRRHFFSSSDSPNVYKIGGGGVPDADLSNSWNGWWLSYLTPDVQNKKTYTRIAPSVAGDSQEFVNGKAIDLGNLILSFDRQSQIWTNNNFQKFFAMCCTLDGYQTVFLGAARLQGVTDAASSWWRNPAIYFPLDFDRRITAINGFAVKDDVWKASTTPTLKEELPDIFHIDVDKGGNMEIKYPGVDLIYGISGQNITYCRFFEKANLEGHIEDYAKGLILNSYLNQFYFSDIVMKAEQMIRVGDLMVAVNFSDDSFEDDTTKEASKNNTKIAVSQMQQGNIPTYDIFTDEGARYKTISTGDEIVGASVVGDNDFMVFTKQQAIHCEILDAVRGTIAVRERFNNKGAVSKIAIVNARLRGELQGTFWASETGIYYFYNNDPVNILENAWLNEYLALDSAVKDAIVAGYNPKRNFVYFVVDDRIFVYHMGLRSWRIYTFPVSPTFMHIADNDEQMFTNGKALFLTEGYGTEKYRDLEGSAEEERITFSMTNVLNEGLSAMHKIPIGFDLSSIEVETDEPGNPVNIHVTVGADSATAEDIYDEGVDIEGKTSHTRQIKTKRRTNFFNFKIEDYDDTALNIIALRINEIVVKTKHTQRKIQKI